MDKIQSNTPKKQHYVPQFLLRNFSYGKKFKLFTFDKSRAKSFEASVKDSASENGFYNLILDGEEYTLEHKLSKLESTCGSVVKKICREESLDSITHEDHIILCVFVANMLLRVKKQRAFLDQINEKMTEWLISMGLDPNEIQNFKTMDQDEVNRSHIEFTHRNVWEFSKRFHGKPIALLKAPNGSNLVISDNPVTMYNHWPQEFRGDKGVSVPGIEIQIPLSKKLCLSFICPLLFSDLEEKLNFLSTRKAQNMPIDNIDTTYAETLASAIRDKKAVELTPEMVKFYNSLQIAESLNYIYSDKNDFKLAEQMLKNNPSLADGKVVWMGF